MTFSLSSTSPWLKLPVVYDERRQECPNHNEKSCGAFGDKGHNQREDVFSFPSKKIFALG